jgi:hypothetical protein
MKAFAMTAAGAAVAAGVLASAAGAQAPQSQTTSLKEKDCCVAQKSKPKEEMPWVTLSCKGAGGLVVRIADVDLRQTVSIGPSLAVAARQPAASESFGPFNHVGDTMEWRLRGAKPYAAIVRWNIADNEDTDASGRPKDVPVLVVMRLAPACQVAFIDATANPDSAALAQKTADEKAEGFRCGNDEAAVVGAAGRGGALAKP